MTMSPSELEFILPEQSALDLVRCVNTLTAKYRKDYFLSEIYLYSGKGKITFTKKTGTAA